MNHDDGCSLAQHEAWCAVMHNDNLHKYKNTTAADLDFQIIHVVTERKNAAFPAIFLLPLFFT